VGGSWDHITDDQGRFTGTALIDNLGDAYEALQQCYGMIQYLAQEIAEDWAAEQPDAEQIAVERADVIEDARQHAADGLALGGQVDE
jgi:hypothetical protein